MSMIPFHHCRYIVCIYRRCLEAPPCAFLPFRIFGRYFCLTNKRSKEIRGRPCCGKKDGGPGGPVDRLRGWGAASHLSNHDIFISFCSGGHTYLHSSVCLPRYEQNRKTKRYKSLTHTLTRLKNPSRSTQPHTHTRGYRQQDHSMKGYIVLIHT